MEAIYNEGRAGFYYGSANNFMSYPTDINWLENDTIVGELSTENIDGSGRTIFKIDTEKSKELVMSKYKEKIDVAIQEAALINKKLELV